MRPISNASETTDDRIPGFRPENFASDHHIGNLTGNGTESVTGVKLLFFLKNIYMSRYIHTEKSRLPKQMFKQKYVKYSHTVNSCMSRVRLKQCLFYLECCHFG